MKKTRKFPRIATLALLVTVAFGTATSVVPLMGQSSDTKEKIRLMSAALRARDAGNLAEAKTNLEELIRIAPNDANVARMLDAVNRDLDSQTTGATPVFGQAANVESFEPTVTTAPVTTATTGSTVDYSAATPTDLDALLQAAAGDQAAQLEQAKLSLKDAKKLSKADRNEEALRVLVNAKGSLPESSATASTLSRIDSAIGEIMLDTVEDALEDGDYDAANAALEKYNELVGDEEIASDIAKAISSVKNDPWNQNVDELSPGFLDRQEKIDKLLVKGRAQILYGDLVGASATLSEIEARDPYNAAAKSLQMKVAELRSTTAQIDRYKTRQQMLEEVDRSWQRPKVFDLDLTTPPPPEGDSVRDKLRRIQVPEFTVRNSPLSRVLENLSLISEENDPEGIGVNMIKPAGEDPEVTIRLRNLTMEQVLNFVANHVAYSWEVQDGVVVMKKTGGDVFLETQFFPISAGTVIRLTGFSGGDSGSAAPVDPFAPQPVAPSGGGPSSSEKEDALKSFFERAGIPFVAPASLAFDGTQLIVTQTPLNLDKLNNILRRYNQPKQVEIETKFLEVQQGALEELGFQWSVNQGINARHTRTFNTSASGRSIAEAFSVDASASQIAINSPDTVIGTGNFTFQDNDGDGFLEAVETTRDAPGLDISVPFLPPSLPDQIDLAENATNLLTNVGIINGNEVNLVVNALSRTEGSDLMSSPRVTVLSGRTAQIVVAQELRYPENYGDIEAQVDSSGGVTNNGVSGGSVAITAGTPQDFTVRNVGVEMEVTPTVEENQNISLKLEPRVTEFEGFVEYGGPSVAISGGVTVTVPSGFFQPIFGVRSVRTEVTIYDGATVVIGGLTREEVKTVKDKVPVLGDIPFLGRIFRSEGETALKRNLLIFVTANLISPGGSPTNQSISGTQANSQFRNPIVVTPGGGVSRQVED